MTNKLQSPLLIVTIILLLLNDFCFKSMFGNAITGKLSDFAGLFAFPFFFSCLLPKYKTQIHVATALIFVWWKSQYSNFFIEAANFINIPIDRTIDFSDNIALISVVLSYFVFASNIQYKQIKPGLKIITIGMALFSFIATTIPKHMSASYKNINKTYTFNKPIDIFVTEFNDLQKNEIKQLDKYKIPYQYNEEDGTYIYPITGDTLMQLIQLGEHRKDTIYVNCLLVNYKVYELDDNTTQLSLSEIKNFKYYAGILNKLFPGTDEIAKVGKFKKKNGLLDNTEQTSLKYINNQDMYVSEIKSDSGDLKKLVREFEKRIVNKLQ